MKAEEAVRRAVEAFAELIKLRMDAVVGVTRDEKSWLVTLEAVHRNAIPDTMDILGLYEVRVAEVGELLNIGRKSLRKRGDTSEPG